MKSFLEISQKKNPTKKRKSSSIFARMTMSTEPKLAMAVFYLIQGPQ